MTEDTDLYDLPMTLKPMTREEEREAFRLRRTADPETKRRIDDQIIRSNMRFAASVAKSWSHRAPYTSMRRAAMRGLAQAQIRFDEDKGFKFISYAVWWIRQEINAEMVERNSLVGLPQRVRERMADYWEAHASSEGATTGEVLDAINCFGAERDDVAGALQGCVHLDADASGPWVAARGRMGWIRDETVGDRFVIPEEPEDDLWTQCWDDPQKTVEAVLSTLTDEEQYVIIRHYGLCGKEVMRQSDIAKGRGVSRQRIQQVHKGALEKVRTSLLRRGTRDLRRALQGGMSCKAS